MIGLCLLTSTSVSSSYYAIQYFQKPSWKKHPSATVDKILNQELTFEMYKDNAVCANGAMYRKDVRGFLPELMDKMYDERVILKKRMLKAKQEYEKTPTIVYKKRSPDVKRSNGEEDCS